MKSKIYLVLIFLFFQILGASQSNKYFQNPLKKKYEAYISAINWGKIKSECIDRYRQSREVKTSLELNNIEVNKKDSLALVSIYNSAQGKYWNNNTNWLQTNVSSWFGIVVDENGRVIEINLDFNNLSGLIPKEIGNISNLQILGFYGNNLNGYLPAEIGKLTKLIVLDIGENNLTGTIPESWNSFYNMEYFYLGINKLIGEIPNDLFDMSKIEWIGLHENMLSGSIPKTIGMLKNASIVDLAINQIEGEIPPEIGLLNNVEWLNLFNNKLKGGLPVELFDLSNLVILNLYDNNLEEEIPNEISNLTKLEVLSLGKNNFKGNILDKIQDITSLKSIFLNENYFTGTIPERFYNLVELYILHLDHNKFEGEISSSIEKLIQLNNFIISDNNFCDSVPKELSKLIQLERLDIGQNSFTYLPVLSSLKKLQTADIRNNYFDFNDLQNSLISVVNDGKIKYSPQNSISCTFDTTQANLVLNCEFENDNCNYQWYNLDTLLVGETTHRITIDTSKSGVYYCVITDSVFVDLQLQTVPRVFNDTSTICGIYKSEYYALLDFYESTRGYDWIQQTNWLSTNDVNSWYGVATRGLNVIELELSSNRMSGYLNRTISNLTELKKVFLYDSNIEGMVPEEVYELENLEYLTLGFNKIEGEISKNIHKLENLKYIDLRGNKMQGSIPEELFNLTGIEVIGIGGNYFTGGLKIDFNTLPNLRILSIRYNLINELPELKNNMGAILAFDGNNLDFGDIEKNIFLSNFMYTNQNKIGNYQELSFDLGDRIELNIQTDGEHNNYQWYKNYMLIEDANEPSYVIDEADKTAVGNYYCIVTNSLVDNLELRTEDYVVDITSSITSKKMSCSIYPNPIKNDLIINSETDIDHIKIIDFNGRVLYNGRYNNEKIDLSNYIEGVYILQIESQGVINTQKIVKQ